MDRHEYKHTAFALLRLRLLAPSQDDPPCDHECYARLCAITAKLLRRKILEGKIE